MRHAGGRHGRGRPPEAQCRITAAIVARPAVSARPAVLAAGRGARRAMGVRRAGPAVGSAPRLGGVRVEIGRAHVCTPVTNTKLGFRILLETKKLKTDTNSSTTSTQKPNT